MCFEGIRPEVQLIATASLTLDQRWYLGYALDEPLPDHASLTRIRERLGVDTFARFFERVVNLCQEAGLIWGCELYFDATEIRADAAVASLVSRFAYEAKFPSLTSSPRPRTGTDSGGSGCEGSRTSTSKN